MKNIFLVLFLSGLIFMSCQTGPNKKNESKADSTAVPVIPQPVASEVPDTIPYVILERYFVKNTVTEQPAPKIETEEQFKSIFSPAAVMGKDGKPTVVDFSKQYVIVVTKPVTDTALKIIPVSLHTSADKTIVFTYKLEKGEKQSFKTKPVLAVVVDKSYTGDVQLKEQ